MKFKHIAIITTALVIIAGLAMISPLFFHNNSPEARPKVMLSFGVVESDYMVEWCQDLASLLEDNNIGASVFFVGKVVEQYPQVISLFSDKVDIGSQTYNNANLTSILDYSVKLREVTQGKMAVDNAGTLYSCIFKAPYYATDQDIYSLLSRSGIIADFSYVNQYNVYLDGKFVKFDAVTYQACDYTSEFFSNISKTAGPVIIYFDNKDEISYIESIISNLNGSDFEYVNASELTGINLTNRGNDLVVGKIAAN